MASNYYQKPTLNDYIRNNFSYFFGSIANLYAAKLQRENIERLPLYKCNKKGEICEELTQTPLTLQETVKEIEQKAIEVATNIYTQTQPFDQWDELDAKLSEEYQKENKKEIGRFYASNLWAILNNRIPPEKYFEVEEKTPQELWKMNSGVLMHKGIQDLFGFEEKKYELLIQKEPKIVIVCKIDLEKDGKIYEFKTRDDISFDYLPPWYCYQIECYLRAKQLDEIELWVINLSGRKKYIYKKNDALWNNIQRGIIEYDKKLRELYDNQSNNSNSK